MLARTTLIAAVLSLVAISILDHGPFSWSSQAAVGTTPAPVTKPYSPSIDPADFGGPIDNPYLPLSPGTRFRYRGVGDDGKTRELNRVTVTKTTKRIIGIDAVVGMAIYTGALSEMGPGNAARLPGVQAPEEQL